MSARFSLVMSIFDKLMHSSFVFLSSQPSKVTVCHQTLFHVSLEFPLCILELVYKGQMRRPS